MVAESYNINPIRVKQVGINPRQKVKKEYLIFKVSYKTIRAGAGAAS
jgi:hypothetical protein